MGHGHPDGFTIFSRSIVEAEGTKLSQQSMPAAWPAVGGQLLTLLEQPFLSAKVPSVGSKSRHLAFNSSFATSRHVALGKSLPFSVPHVYSLSSRCRGPDGDRPVSGSPGQGWHGMIMWPGQKRRPNQSCLAEVSRQTNRAHCWPL